MSDVAIRVEGLGKRYHLGAARDRYQTLGEQVRRWTSLRTLLRRGERAEKRPPFWALKDVSFEVKRGEVVGIIGRNGAGKSTLLKILSQITEPTEGAVDLHGRVGSLLEVGTGFHPELTGRENIYLNGAILGMRRAEVVHKFDEIVAFAEVEKFVDTPVKHYSSGMYTRLAFAVAAHLEPEILIVDEVLAVGDAEFQRKCLGKMGEVAKGGRTVLFVSHNMSAVQSLCGRAILLREGQLAVASATTEAVAAYQAAYAVGSVYRRPAYTSGPVCVREVRVEVTQDGGRTLLTTDLLIESREASAVVSLDLGMHDVAGSAIGLAAVGAFNITEEVKLYREKTCVKTVHDVSHLANGIYRLSVNVAQTMIGYLDRIDQCVTFEIARPIPMGDFRVMHQQMGFGCLRVPYLKHSSAPI